MRAALGTFSPETDPRSLRPRSPPREAAHLSIVVLPFANLSGDPSQDYFADAITDNLITDLAHIKGSFVIARNTAFTFKGKNIDAKEIGKELGVRYVLEGSAQRDQTRGRVNAQLIDAESGAHLWAERFEEDLSDLFKLQDQVVARLSNTLGFELVKAEAEKSTHSQGPDVVDLDMRGWVMMQQWLGTTKEYVSAARAWFEQALKIDPNDPEPWRVRPTPIFRILCKDGETPRSITRQRCSVRQTGPSRSLTTLCGRIT